MRVVVTHWVKKSEEQTNSFITRQLGPPLFYKQLNKMASDQLESAEEEISSTVDSRARSCNRRSGHGQDGATATALAASALVIWAPLIQHHIMLSWHTSYPIRGTDMMQILFSSPLASWTKDSERQRQHLPACWFGSRRGLARSDGRRTDTCVI